MGLPEVNIRTLVRTGDTPASERTAMTKRPPHIVVTTPESLYILLTSEGGRRMLQTARTLIVDEIHAVVGDKRGSHLALSIERLEQLIRSVSKAQSSERRRDEIRHSELRNPKFTRPHRISATQRPIEEVARFLVGTETSIATALLTARLSTADTRAVWIWRLNFPIAVAGRDVGRSLGRSLRSSCATNPPT